METEFTIGLDIYLSKIVIATSPKHIVFVAIDDGDTGEARRMKDIPHGMIIIEQTFKIGHKHCSALTCINVEINAVGLIIIGRVILQEGHTLSHEDHRLQQ